MTVSGIREMTGYVYLEREDNRVIEFYEGQGVFTDEYRYKGDIYYDRGINIPSSSKLSEDTRISESLRNKIHKDLSKEGRALRSVCSSDSCFQDIFVLFELHRWAGEYYYVDLREGDEALVGLESIRYGKIASTS